MKSNLFASPACQTKNSFGSIPNAAFCEIRHGPLSYGLWHARQQRVEKIHQWQQWLSRVTEVVQGDNQRARLAGVARSEVVPDQHDYEAISNR